MKFKRIIAFCLVSIVILSSVGFNGFEYSTDEIQFKVSRSIDATQLVADNEDPSHEFRGGLKLNHTTQSRIVFFSVIYVAVQCAFETLRYAQYEAYLHKRFNQDPSVKLFLDFRSLII